MYMMARIYAGIFLHVACWVPSPIILGKFMTLCEFSQLSDIDVHVYTVAMQLPIA